MSFYFKPEFSQRLLHKINFTNYEDLPYLAHKLTSESRQNILETMLLADGTKKKDTWVFGKKMKKGGGDLEEKPAVDKQAKA